MPIYGRYEVVERMHESLSATVSRARLVDGRKALFVVKVFLPRGATVEAQRLETQAFLEATRIQQQLSADPKHNWAPIRHVAALPVGGFYVLNSYPSSVSAVIDGEDPIHPDGLHRIVSGVVEGLRQLRTVAKRAHGNLKTGNILLTATRPAEASVLLTDPLAASALTASSSLSDIRAIGDAIHQLVVRRASPPASQLLPESPEWDRLGTSGAEWHRLCSTLLSPSAKKPVTLEAIATTLEAMGTRQRHASLLPRLSRITAVAALVLILFGGGGLTALDYTARRELCRIKTTWLGPFAEAVAEPARLRWYASDPGLKRLLDDVDMADPRGVDCDLSLSHLRPWEYLKDSQRLAAARHAVKDLSPSRWQRLGEDTAIAQRFDERGWKQPATLLKQVVDAVTPTSGAALAPAIDRLLLTDEPLRHDLPALETQWNQFDIRLHELDGARDPFVLATPAALRASAAADIRLSEAGLTNGTAIRDNLKLADRLIAAIHNGYPDRFDTDRLFADVTSKLDLQQLTPAQVSDWIGALPAYELQRERVATASAELRQSISAISRRVADRKLEGDELTKFKREQQQADADVTKFAQARVIARDLNDGTFEKRRSKVAARIDALAAYDHTQVAIVTPTPTPIPPTPKPAPTPAPKPTPAPPAPAPSTPPLPTPPTPTPPTVKPPVPIELLPPVATRPTTVPTPLPVPPGPAEWVRSVTVIASTSDAINAYWEDWKHLLQSSIAEMNAQPAFASTMKQRTEGLRSLLEGLDKQFPAAPVGLNAEFVAAAKEHRERELGKVLSTIDPKSPDKSSPNQKVAAADYTEWSGDLVELSHDFPVRAELLKLSDRPDLKWQKARPNFWNDRPIQSLVHKDVDRIQRLADLKGFGRADLVDAATSSTTPEVTFAAWQLLGDPSVRPAWPSRPGELETDRDLRQKLATMAKNLKDPAERAASTDALAQSGPQRWRVFTEAATSEAMLQSAIDLEPLFGTPASLVDSLKPTARFNLVFYQARQQVRHGDEDGARKAMASLAKAAADVPDHQLAELVDRINSIDPREKLADRLPGDRYTLPVPGAQPGMEFQRVSPLDDRPYYLGTTELAFGQFAGVTNSATAWETLKGFHWLAEPSKRDTRRGPRVWEWTERPALQMTVPMLWLFPDDDNDYAPAFRITRFNRTALTDEVGGNPSADHPMQQIPAEAALYFAGLCGCRLPTTAEWREAYAVYERTVPPERWNLRDQTFETQRKHVADNGAATARWPDEAIFKSRSDTNPTGADAKSRSTSDGSLFFRKVSAPGGGTFHHLVGNVAEFLCDAPDAFDAWPQKQSVEGIRKFIQQYPGTIFVIGGSALSAPDVPVDQPIPVLRTDLGYSDVGLRLAFTAPARSMIERMRWVMSGQRYFWEKTDAGPTTSPAAAAAR